MSTALTGHTYTQLQACQACILSMCSQLTTDSIHNVRIPANGQHRLAARGYLSPSGILHLRQSTADQPALLSSY